MPLGMNLGSVWGDFLYLAAKSPVDRKYETAFSKKITSLKNIGKFNKTHPLEYVRDRFLELKNNEKVSNANKLIAFKVFNSALEFNDHVEDQSNLSAIYTLFKTNIDKKIEEIEVIDTFITQSVDPFLEEKTKEVEASQNAFLSDCDRKIKERNSAILKNTRKEVRQIFKEHHVKKFEELTKDQQAIIKKSQENATSVESVDFLIKNMGENTDKEKVMALIWINVLRKTGINLYKKMYTEKLQKLETGASAEEVIESTKERKRICKLWNYSSHWEEHQQEILKLAYCKNSQTDYRRLFLEGSRLCYLTSVLEEHPNRKEEAITILEQLEENSKTGQDYINQNADAEPALFKKIEKSIEEKFGVSFSPLESTATIPGWIKDALN